MAKENCVTTLSNIMCNTYSSDPVNVHDISPNIQLHWIKKIPWNKTEAVEKVPDYKTKSIFQLISFDSVSVGQENKGSILLKF